MGTVARGAVARRGNARGDVRRACVRVCMLDECERNKGMRIHNR